MATTQSANPIYHDPTPGRTRTRRNSSRRSFASSLSRSNSHLESPRAACPRDGSAFSYDPTHLRAWCLPQEIWNHLPAELQSALAALQHSGAAVLTGFARAEEHTESIEKFRLDSKIPEDELLGQLDDLPPPKFGTLSNTSSVFSSTMSSPTTPASPDSQSGSASPVTSSFSPSSQPLWSLSPVSLGPPVELFEKRPSRERSFSTPLEPGQNAYYTTELSHLRTEALPRLRHLGRKVDTEWFEAKRLGNISAEDVSAFEIWWAEKKSTITSLNERCTRIANALGLAPTGMGWCAP